MKLAFRLSVGSHCADTRVDHRSRSLTRCCVNVLKSKPSRLVIAPAARIASVSVSGTLIIPLSRRVEQLPTSPFAIPSKPSLGRAGVTFTERQSLVVGQGVSMRVNLVGGR